MAAKVKTNVQDEYQSLAKLILAGNFSPVYLLQGEEFFYIERLANLLEQKVLQPAEKDFNLHIYYGVDTDPNEIIAKARQYPMFANKQLIMVKEAQNLENLELLMPYLLSPVQSTILVLCLKGKKVNMATKEGKAFRQHTIFNSDLIADWDMMNWIMKFSQTKDMIVEEREARLLNEYLGNNPGRISHELDVLKINLGERKKVEVKDIENFIGVSRNYNVFELQKAIGAKDFAKAIKIAYHFSVNIKSHPLVVTVANLNSYFQKVLSVHIAGPKSPDQLASILGVAPYFVKDYTLAAKNYPLSKLKIIFDTLCETDLKFKGIMGNNIPDDALYSELIVKIMRQS
jgi:DNA polymerase-3 subunit delta